MENNTTKCKFCKEEIKSDAIKCKHCHSKLESEKPDHKGVCPYCKEEVNPEAIKCKHCTSIIGTTDSKKCNCTSRNDDSSSNQNRGSFLRMVDEFPDGWGQGCYNDCVKIGNTHELCQDWCAVSMPRFRARDLYSRRY